MFRDKSYSNWCLSRLASCALSSTASIHFRASELCDHPGTASRHWTLIKTLEAPHIWKEGKERYQAVSGDKPKNIADEKKIDEKIASWEKHRTRLNPRTLWRIDSKSSKKILSAYSPSKAPDESDIRRYQSSGRARRSKRYYGLRDRCFPAAHRTSMIILISNERSWYRWMRGRRMPIATTLIVERAMERTYGRWVPFHTA